MGARNDIVAAAIAAILILPRPAIGEPSERPAEESARQALARGDELRATGRCEAAVTSWRQGFARVAHWAFLLRIGDCYARLGRHEDAIPYLLRGLELGGDELREGQRAQVQASLERSRAALPARLVVVTDVGGATISVDGAAVGTTPALEPFEVEPGEHVVTLSRRGLGSAEERVTARRGERAYVDLALEPVSGEERDDTTRLGPLWGSLLLALGAGLAGGGTYLAVVDNQRIDAESYRGLDSLGPGVGLAALGGGLLVGGIVLLALRPAAPRPPGEEDP